MAARPELSVVICYRNWGGERLRLAIESHLRSTIADRIEVIVSDFGSEPERRAESALSDLAARVVYTDTDESWSRGRALNAGVAEARGKYILAWDADILCGPELHEILLAQFEAQAEAAYVFQCRDLDSAFDENRVAGYFEERRDLPLEAMREHSMWRPRWGMGIAAYRRADFDRIRGYDERFIIWGGEDRDLMNRFARSGLPVRWVDDERAEIYHIFHESSQDKAKATAAGQSAVSRNHDYVRNDRSVFRNLRAPAYFRSLEPLISVVIASYNREAFIRQSVESVLNQTFSDLELLVVDDGSTDGTAGVLEQIEDPRLVVIRKENGGVASARNEAMRRARGHFIVVHDDDDIMLPDRLESHLSAMTGNQGGSYGGWIDFDDETGEFISINPGKEFSAAAIAHAGKVLLHPTVMTTRRIAREVPYDERYRGGSDFNWMMTIADAGVELVHTGRIHTLRRVHGRSLTSSGSGQKHASRAAVRSLSSVVGRESAQDDRAEGREAEFVPCRDFSAVHRLYEHLPSELQQDRYRFEATVDAGDLGLLSKRLRASGDELLVEAIEPLGEGGVFTRSVWFVAGWTDSEKAALECLGSIAGSCTVSRIPGPRHVRDDRIGISAPPRSSTTAPRGATLAQKLPEDLWPLLDRLAAHRGITADQLLVAGRARTERPVSARKVGRLLKSAAKAGMDVEPIALVESPEGAVPLYCLTGNWRDSRWSDRLVRKWALARIALVFMEAGESKIADRDGAQ